MELQDLTSANTSRTYKEMGLEDMGPEGCNIRPDWGEIYWHRGLIHDNSGFNILSRKDTWSWCYYIPEMVL